MRRCRPARGREAGSALPQRALHHGLQKRGCHSSVPTCPRWTSSRLTSSAIAQRERKLISTRTREARALKQRGVTKKDNPVRLGNPKNGTEEQTAKANVGAKRKADASAGTVIREIRKWQAKGITTYKDLADMLTGKTKRPAARIAGRPLRSSAFWSVSARECRRLRNAQ